MESDKGVTYVTEISGEFDLNMKIGAGPLMRLVYFPYLQTSKIIVSKLLKNLNIILLFPTTPTILLKSDLFTTN